MDRIDIKKELIKKTEELLNKDNTKTLFKDINDIQKRWKKTCRDEESFLEKELHDKFEDNLNKLLQKTGILNKNVTEVKEELIKEAEKLLNANNFKNATNKMNDLLEQWKMAGKAPKEIDDALWDKFSSIKKEFNNKKDDYFKHLKENFEITKNKKEEIIKEAMEANKKDNFKEIGSIMDSLLEKWKEAGRGEKSSDDELWKQFNEQRKLFFKNRKEYYNSMKDTFIKRAEEKKELIAKAKQCLARSEFTKEEMDTIESIKNEFRKIGTCGKEFEGSLKEEFNNIMKKYNENKKYYGK